MEENLTTTYENVRGRAKYLMSKHPDHESMLMAVCEEVDRIHKRIDELETKVLQTTHYPPEELANNSG